MHFSEGDLYMLFGVIVVSSIVLITIIGFSIRYTYKKIKGNKNETE